MQSVSALYLSISNNPNHWYEAKLDIDGVGTFYETGERPIFSISTSNEMFSGEPKVGMAVAGEITVTMAFKAADLPNMACLRPYARICDEGRQSEWIPQGVFFVDTREQTANEDGLSRLTLHGYDAMLKAEQNFQSNTITGDSVDVDMVNEIASIMGVSVDARTWERMTASYTIPLPTGYTLREVLGYIASMYVGCFIMTDEGKLRLVSILELPPETNYLIDNAGDAITFGGDRILV